MTEPPSVSVICNTLNRADALADLLAALRRLTYPRFEVVVVVGPVTDHTLAVLAPYEGRVKVVRCPEANLSRSRNLGIAAAAGDIVAFIDDDGIPEPTWLDDLVAGYDGADVAGVGGAVRDHTGYTFQCRFCRADRIGNADPSGEVPLDELCVPGSWEVPYLIGTNASFRRQRLVEVGGFDEEFEFYLDETDVCMRLMDRGWRLRQLPGAEVHHKFLPSAVRNNERVTVDLYSVVKNRLYFSHLHAMGEAPTSQIMASHTEWVRLLTEDLETHHRAGRISDEDLAHGLRRIDDGWQAGLRVGARGRQVMLDADAAAHPPPFLPYATIERPERPLRVCLVSQFLPPEETSGTGRFVLDTARELAARGHDVHILTSSSVGHDTVDLEEGVWVHRLVKTRPRPPSTIHARVPARIWHNAVAVADEVERLHAIRPVDVVLGVMWDVETIAVRERTAIPVVTTLVTTLGITLRTRPEWTTDPAFMADFGEPMLALERWLMERSDAVHAISDAILTEASEVGAAVVDPARATVAPLGVVDHLGPPAPPPEGDPTVLFVGRFEKRKGIDLLLGAIPQVLATHPSVRFVLLGAHDLPGEHGESYRDVFLREHAGAPWMDRVEMPGIVDDDELWDAYRRCDVFVAPSRFESFGLVYVEAMMAGRPVVALDAGAAPEVVVAGATGELVEADADALAAAISALLADPALRHRMGAAGRRRFEEHYSAAAMAERVERLLVDVVAGVRV